MENLMDGLNRELERNRQLAKDYEAIGLPGRFGLLVITISIQEGEKAIKEGDTVGMVKAFAKLQSNK